MGGSKYFHLLISTHVCGVVCDSVTGMSPHVIFYTVDLLIFVAKYNMNNFISTNVTYIVWNEEGDIV